LAPLPPNNGGFPVSAFNENPPLLGGSGREGPAQGADRLAWRPGVSAVGIMPTCYSLLWAFALVALFGQVVVYLAHAAVVVPYPFDLDQGEGYDLNSGWLLAQGRPIYTDNSVYPYYSSNYPPLYALVVAAGIWIWGPSLAVGRAVSLAATLGLGLLIFLAGRGRAGSAGGLVAAGLFFLSNYVYHTTLLARVNALTALLALGGVLLLDGRSRWRLVLGLACLLGALFSKPTAIDALLAGLAALALRSPRRGLLGALVVLVVGGGLALALEVASRGAFSLNVLLGNVNPFSPDQLGAYLRNFALLHGALLGLAVVGLATAVRAKQLDGTTLFFLSGLLMALGVGKWGAGESYFLSAIAAGALLAGRAASGLIRRRGLASGLAAVVVLVQCAISAHGAVSARLGWLPDRGLQAAALAADPVLGDLERGHSIVSRLREVGGPNLLEEPGFGIALGQEVVGNATHLRNLYQAGLWDPARLVADLTARRYHTVVLHAELYPEPVLVAIGAHYFLYDTVDVYGAAQQVFLPGAS
jgi:hypothetical protein